MGFDPLGLMDRPVFRRLVAAVLRGYLGVIPQVDDPREAAKNTFENSNLSRRIPFWKCPLEGCLAAHYSFLE
jgi:hypothetical protein